jgi:hypothetical protein
MPTFPVRFDGAPAPVKPAPLRLTAAAAPTLAAGDMTNALLGDRISNSSICFKMTLTIVPLAAGLYLGCISPAGRGLRCRLVDHGHAKRLGIEISPLDTAARVDAPA